MEHDMKSRKKARIFPAFHLFSVINNYLFFLRTVPEMTAITVDTSRDAMLLPRPSS